MTSAESKAFARGIGPLLRLLPPEIVAQIIALRGDPELSARIELLATKNTEGELTSEERAEFAGYVRANKFVAVFQRHVRRACRLEQMPQDVDRWKIFEAGLNEFTEDFMQDREQPTEHQERPSLDS